jgi:phage terminase small subunit
MPALRNIRHERFAQELAKGKEAGEAYEAAGFTANDGNARRLKQNEAIMKRVEALLSEREHIHVKAIERAIEKTGITIGRVIEELAKIGFADIRKAVRWSGIASPDDGGQTSTLVEVVASSDIDADTAAAISEISQSDKGALKIKFHDKRAALVDIGRHLGAFPSKVEVVGKDGGPIEYRDLSGLSDAELDALESLGAKVAISGRNPSGETSKG